MPAARRRTQLLDTAATLLAEGHTEQLTMEGIAARAGVSKALCYRYFDNADELLVALAEREMVEVARRVRNAMAATVTFEASVRASLAAWFDVLAERGDVIVALLSTSRLAGDLGQRRRQLRSVVGDFYARRAADAFGLEPRVASTATVILLAGMEGLIDCWVEHGNTRRELVDTYTTICLAAYQALADEPPMIG
jgi:AcrR family transcriptional regulator